MQNNTSLLRFTKKLLTKNWGGLRPHLPPTRPFTHYSIDFMFGFPSDGGGPLQYDGIMVCVDMFSKRVIAIPVWEAAYTKPHLTWKGFICDAARASTKPHCQPFQKSPMPAHVAGSRPTPVNP